MCRMKLTQANYYSREANEAYMSASQYKSFARCEAAAMAELRGEWSRGSTQASPAVELIQLHQGDQVEHTAFGKGTVLSVKPMGGDALVEVAFDSVGTKKLMLKMAAQHLKIV